jgi:FkbM family methyltransferase
MRRILSKNSNCIDVGCHAGVMLDEILKFSPDGSHYGFEPLPDLSEKLMEKFLHIENVLIKNSALSDFSGISNFQHVVSNPGYSGLKQRRYDRPNEEIHQISVKTERLDDIIPIAMRISFIKIDVEGAELQVLRGAVETIKRSHPAIVFEHGLGAADCYETTPEDVYDLLNDTCGLKCFTMERWLSKNGAENLSRNQFSDEFRSGRNYYFLAA